jgi:uncharacterized protein with PQ loop repeat
MRDSEEIGIDWGDDVDLDTLAARMRVDPKSKATNYIAFWIVAIFGAAVILVLLGGILICILKSPGESEQVITKAFLPFLQALANFISVSFGPLLAFILVYYFRPNKGRAHLP